ncbi:MAG: hypothetical protein CSA18_00100 [Deltaproteobacteria bacterium]|nr:MAG: hypothetical protein CSA18_00100 [Deltaproteobacteria bacterium]
MEKDKLKKNLKKIIFLIITIVFLSIANLVLIKKEPSIGIPVSILVYFIININFILLLILIFLILRSLVKSYYERRLSPGSKIKNRLLIAFIMITLIPNIMLFISSVSFINSSIAYWFNAPVEQALTNSLEIGRNYLKYIEKNHRIFISRIIQDIKTQNHKQLGEKIKESSFDFIEIYNEKGKRKILITDKGQIPVTKIQNIEKFPVTMINEYKNKKIIKTIIKKNSGFISTGIIADSDLFTRIKKITKGYDEYKQIKLMRNSVKTTYILALFVVSFLVIFSAIWFAFYFSKTITDPVIELVNATKKISDGDLDVKIEPRTNDETGTLVSAFNSMTAELKGAKETLQKRNEELKNRARYIETILRNISTGVIAVDSKGIITAANPFFGKIFMKDPAFLQGKFYKDVLPEKYCELASRYMDSGSQKNEEDIPFQLQDKKDPKNLLLKFSSIYDENGVSIGMVTACKDVTELEKAQRMAAWREVARQIAHEVKNPLTPLSLAAQRLQKKFPELSENNIFNECTNTIVKYVEIIKILVNEFADYARFPSPTKSLCRFEEILDTIIPLHREKYPDINFKINYPSDIPLISIDKRQISQALINLIDNAAAAMNNNGIINLCVSYLKNKKILRINLSDSGPGVNEDKKQRLFEPYFSTKKSGTGLGLTIVNSIISSHGGSIKIDGNELGGASFIIDLPV